jgi:hypothetical protein
LLPFEVVDSDELLAAAIREFLATQVGEYELEGHSDRTHRNVSRSDH